MSATARIAERASVFGRLGGTLLNSLRTYVDEGRIHSIYHSSLTNQIIAVEALSRNCSGDRLLVPVAVSLLVCKYPVQVPITQTGIKLLVSSALDLSPKLQRHRANAYLTSGRHRALHFPYKSHPSATTRVNFRSLDVYRAGVSCGLKTLYDNIMKYTSSKISDDQLAATFLYGAALNPHFPGSACLLASAIILDPLGAKQLSNAIKALGANSDDLGALLCEATSLQGRMCGTVDLDAESRNRTNPRTVADSVIPYRAEFRDIIRAILREELPDAPVFEPLDTFWTKRWKWCVNGSHSTVVDGRVQVDTSQLPGITRVYRRMFAEAVPTEPISTWDAHVRVSPSSKLEHGKTRTIFACDTLSYFAFQHLLGPIQDSWANRRVILDPGALGDVGWAERIRSTAGQSGINLMLDYEDFNSQHSTETMKVLLEETCLYSGYDPILASNLVASFDHMHIYSRGRFMGRVLGTLMSGHRATTYINSVLNATYIRAAVGDTLYRQTPAFHVGDDVYMSPPTYEHAAQILEGCSASGCRMNPIKQSLGAVSGEFLRQAVDRRCSRGYAARSIASFISGNWIDERELNPEERFRSTLELAYTVHNRTRCDTLARVMGHLLSRQSLTRLDLTVGLIRGTHALEGSAHLPTDHRIHVVDISISRQRPSEVVNPQWPLHATCQYLQNHVTPFEAEALQLSEINPTTAMALTSYRKGLPSVPRSQPAAIILRKRSPVVPVGSSSAATLDVSAPSYGILSRYPLLQMFRREIPHPVLRQLVYAHLGMVPIDNWDQIAWGDVTHNSIVTQPVSYGDLTRLSKASVADVITVSRPCYM